MAFPTITSSPTPVLNDYDFEECTDEECFKECRDQEDSASTLNVILMSVRCAVTVFTIAFIVLAFVSVIRGLRVKSWRLYLLTALTIFAWVAMSLYKEHIDVYYVRWLECDVQSR